MFSKLFSRPNTAKPFLNLVIDDLRSTGLEIVDQRRQAAGLPLNASSGELFAAASPCEHATVQTLQGFVNDAQQIMPKITSAKEAAMLMNQAIEAFRIIITTKVMERMTSEDRSKMMRLIDSGDPGEQLGILVTRYSLEQEDGAMIGVDKASEIVAHRWSEVH